MSSRQVKVKTCIHRDIARWVANTDKVPALHTSHHHHHHHHHHHLRWHRTVRLVSISWTCSVRCSRLPVSGEHYTFFSTPKERAAHIAWAGLDLPSPASVSRVLGLITGVRAAMTSYVRGVEDLNPGFCMLGNHPSRASSPAFFSPSVFFLFVCLNLFV